MSINDCVKLSISLCLICFPFVQCEGFVDECVFLWCFMQKFKMVTKGSGKTFWRIVAGRLQIS